MDTNTFNTIKKTAATFTTRYTWIGFVRSDATELVNHKPEYTILHAPELLAKPNEDGTNSGVFVILALDRGLVIIGGTHYAGEIKKAIFNVMNHILPAKGLLPMHCSANVNSDGKVAF